MDVNRMATLYSLKCHCHTNECRKQLNRRRCPRNRVGIEYDGRGARAGWAAIGELAPLCSRAEAAMISNIEKESDRSASPCVWQIRTREVVFCVDVALKANRERCSAYRANAV